MLKSSILTKTFVDILSQLSQGSGLTWCGEAHIIAYNSENSEKVTVPTLHNSKTLQTGLSNKGLSWNILFQARTRFWENLLWKYRRNKKDTWTFHALLSFTNVGLSVSACDKVDCWWQGKRHKVVSWECKGWKENTSRISTLTNCFSLSTSYSMWWTAEANSTYSRRVIFTSSLWFCNDRCQIDHSRADAHHLSVDSEPVLAFQAECL